MKLIGILWTMASLAAAASNDPGDAALRFLEKVRAGTVDLKSGGDTAILPDVITSKKLEITNRYERMATEIGSSVLQIAEVNKDPEFAAVLVKQNSIFDPSRLQIIPIALIKLGETWRVAPVPASFENTQSRFQLQKKPRLTTLENWMLRRQVTLLDQLKTESANQLRTEIHQSIDLAKLKAAEPESIVRQFIKACENKELPKILAFLGGHSNEFPKDWPSRLWTANQLATSSAPLLTLGAVLASKNTLKVISPLDGKIDPSYTIELFNPEDSRIHSISLTLSKSTDQLWQVNLQEDLSENIFPIAKNEAKLAIKSTIAEDFFTRFSKHHSSPPSETAELALSHLSETLNSRSFPDLIALSEAVETTHSHIAATALWQRVTKPDSTTRYSSPISLKQIENFAVGMIQVVSTKNPQKPETEIVAFKKSSAGWLWIPNPSAESLLPYREWISSTTKSSDLNWQTSLVQKTSPFNTLNSDISSSPRECEQLVANWLKATTEGNIEKLLRYVSRLNDSTSIPAMLQNIGYEISNAKLRNPAKTSIKIYQSQHLLGAGVQIQQHNGKTIYPFYPIARTSEGLKILVEIDLFASAKNNRDFLNNAALDRFLNSTSPEIAQDLKELLLQFQADLTHLSE